MKNRKTKISSVVFTSVLSILFTSNLGAKEKIIQQEEISFEKCLKVIATSETKLAVSPEIRDESDKKRLAIFKLADGILTITCDGIDGLVTISTKIN